MAERCTMPVSLGGRTQCNAYRCHDLPVCASHLRQWAVANPREFAKMRLGRIRQAAARKANRRIDLYVYRRPGPSCWETAPAGGVIRIGLAPEDATVIGDELASLGDAFSCEMIVRAVQRLGTPRGG